MAKSALALFVRTRLATGGALVTMARDAFAADLLHYVTANNDQCVTESISALPMGGEKVKGKQYQAIGDAIAKAYKACQSAMPDGRGFVSAGRGSFSAQPADFRTPYLAAHAQAVALFGDVLTESGAFADKAPLTPEEKAAKKAEKEEAQALALAEKAQALIDARVAAGELVKRENVHMLGDYSAGALIDQLAGMAGMLTPDDVDALAQLVSTARAYHKAAAKAAAKAPAPEALAA